MKDKDLVAEAMASLTNKGDGEEHGGGSAKPDAGAVEATKTLSLSTTDTQDAKRASRKYKKRVKDPEHKFPVEPRIIQVFHKPKSCVNHSYRDFSGVPPEPGHYSTPNIDEMTFAEKLHHMLNAKEFEKMISWMPHGRAFKVLRPSDFERRVMPTYFGHSRYSGFLSMVRQYGLKQLTKTGPDQGCLYHEFMLRGLPHLAKYMPLPRNPRRLEEDPENEPDLYAISNLYPLPLDGGRYPEALVQHAAPAVCNEQQHVVLVAPPSTVQHQQAAVPGTFMASGTSSFAPAGLVGYPHAQQFLFASAAPTTSYTAATPQFNTHPNFGSFPTIATTGAAGAAAAQFQTAAPMQYGQFIMAGGVPTTAAPTLINSNGHHQQFLSIATPGVVDTSTDSTNNFALGSVVGSSAPPNGTLFIW